MNLQNINFDNIDLSELENLYVNNTKWFNESSTLYYKLLSWFSTHYNNATLFDIGSYEGNSAIALSYCKQNNVVSYDINPLLNLKAIPNNVEFKIGDFRVDEQILKSPFIFIDVDPHDGIQELEFHNFFKEKNYSGIIVWDDIHLNGGMQNFWNTVQKDNSLICFDLTHVGHYSGTGLVKY